MKTNTKLSILAISIISTLSVNAFAQAQVAVPTLAPVEVQQVNKGNSFEREITPLLREFARKKSQLELRKIDRELEKIDEESLKAQLDADSSSKNSSSSSNGAYDPFAGAAKSNVQMVQPTMTVASETVSDVKVLMIYGFDSKLFAKITSGQQGGYVVKAGDIMPDGRVVSNITSNYIEVKKSTGKTKAGVERIFVSASVQATESNSNQPTPPSAPLGGSGGSAQVNKISTATPQALANETAAGSLVTPIKSPGMIQ